MENDPSASSQEEISKKLLQLILDNVPHNVTHQSNESNNQNFKQQQNQLFQALALHSFKHQKSYFNQLSQDKTKIQSLSKFHQKSVESSKPNKDEFHSSIQRINSLAGLCNEKMLQLQELHEKIQQQSVDIDIAKKNLSILVGRACKKFAAQIDSTQQTSPHPQTTTEITPPQDSFNSTVQNKILIQASKQRIRRETRKNIFIRSIFFKLVLESGIDWAADPQFRDFFLNLENEKPFLDDPS